MLTQEELELQTYAFGQERMRKAIEKNEDKGGAPNNPYAQAVYRRFVLPLAAAIEADVDTPRVGRAQAHVPLLRGMDYEAVAFVAVRGVLASVLRGAKDHGGRDVVKEVGSNVYHEYLLTQFADAEPVLFYHLMHDMDRKLSSNEQHRMTVMKMQAKKAGVEFKEWGQAERDQIGGYLIDQLNVLGMVETRQQLETKQQGSRVVRKTMITVTLSDAVKELIVKITDFVVESTPYFLPCIEKPKDWVAIDDGGFHTRELRRLSPWMVKTYSSTRDDYRSEEMRHEMAAVNALQSVKWRINNRMLAAIIDIAKVHDLEEIIAQAEQPKPHRPEWLTQGMKSEDMSTEQQVVFKKWKRETAEWHTEQKIRGAKSNRFYTTLRVARQFKDYPEIYFVYFVDFRGRKYVQTTGVSPQGSDMQKALLEFSEGKPLDTKEAQEWFCIAGANRWGYDKASLSDRVKWTELHKEQILSFAADPVNNSEWKEADKPLQFLAWCFEFANWKALGSTFLSRIAVGMDGSCNGLQNFSAMLRDSHGGRATNLLPSPLPQDIYQSVADRVSVLMQNSLPVCANPDISDWLTHGITRSLVKRSVMTLPYGSRKTSWAEFIETDYLKAGNWPALEKARWPGMSRLLASFLGNAIADVVVAATGAMTWLQDASTAILRKGYDRIQWTTPSGFPVTQVYWETDEHRINTKLCGGAKLSIRRDTEDAKRSRHRNGVAPNFVHSLDASHLTLVVKRAAARGITAFAMIHDDYGTHPADTQALYEIIREVFVEMYTRHDVLEEFRARYSFLPEPPPMGDLDLNQVLDSKYFFS